ncbi:hypothetical protein [Streptomyces sp. CRN 30]|uniref:hypothetical protein n=1 Tax=Streptomyces sp. CRN 30 TaxID=3075613 RepID=UPI002A81481C|nr:hypothetical protein [Streptomyces sp. CRN 30]
MLQFVKDPVFQFVEDLVLQFVEDPLDLLLSAATGTGPVGTFAPIRPVTVPFETTFRTSGSVGVVWEFGHSGRSTHTLIHGTRPRD